MKTKQIGIIALLAIITLALIACKEDDPPPQPQTDPALNGTWVTSTPTPYTYKFNNGTVETTMYSKPDYKGTFTTNSSTLTTTITHIWGKVWASILEEKWYTKAETKAAATSLTEEQVNGWFATFTETYSINGNTLTLTSNSGVTTTFTKE